MLQYREIDCSRPGIYLNVRSLMGYFLTIAQEQHQTYTMDRNALLTWIKIYVLDINA